MKKGIAILSTIAALSSSTAFSSELTWNFKNPAFNGIGYSNHVLTTEQLQFNRKEDLEKAAKAEEERLQRELENSTLNKFLRNVESRIYATLSKQMVDAMFADCGDNCANTGTAEIEGSTLTWTKDPISGSITLEVLGDDGTTTSITIPGAGEFNF